MFVYKKSLSLSSSLFGIAFGGGGLFSIPISIMIIDIACRFLLVAAFLFLFAAVAVLLAVLRALFAFSFVVVVLARVHHRCFCVVRIDRYI